MPQTDIESEVLSREAKIRELEIVKKENSEKLRKGKEKEVEPVIEDSLTPEPAPEQPRAENGPWAPGGYGNDAFKYLSNFYPDGIPYTVSKRLREAVDHPSKGGMPELNALFNEEYNKAEKRNRGIEQKTPLSSKNYQQKIHGKWEEVRATISGENCRICIQIKETSVSTS